MKSSTALQYRKVKLEKTENKMLERDIIVDNDNIFGMVNYCLEIGQNI